MKEGITIQKNKPKDLTEYKKWLQDSHSVQINGSTETYYYAVIAAMKRGLEKSDLWTFLMGNIHAFDDEYFIKNSFRLFIPNYTLQIYEKTFDSFLEKTFRKNVVDNKNWPSEPQGGWILPNNWFSKINDILRTLLVVKYLDGADFLVEKISSFCEKSCVKQDCFYEARDEGYYAIHLYFELEFEIPKVDWDTEKIKTKIEVQITTQLQEVIRGLLHKSYSEKRKKPVKTKKKWQWEYKDDEFASNYLGHILHYVEGMIMEVRSTNNKEEEK